MTSKFRYTAPVADHTLVAIDLGKPKAGLAWGNVVGGEAKLICATTVWYPRGPRIWTPATMAQTILDAVYQHDSAAVIDTPKPVFVCETMQYYANRPHTHKNLDELMALKAALAEAMPRRNFSKVWTPHAWKGNVPKEVHRRRLLEKNYGGLTAAEVQAIDGRNHDTLDALGIWLFAAGRIGRGGAPQ